MKKMNTITFANTKISINSDNYYNPSTVINHPEGVATFAISFGAGVIIVPIITALASTGITAFTIAGISALGVPLGNQFIYGKHGYNNPNFSLQDLPTDAFTATHDALRFAYDAGTQIGSVYCIQHRILLQKWWVIYLVIYMAMLNKHLNN